MGTKEKTGIKRSRHLWTPKEIAFIHGLAQFGCDPELIVEAILEKNLIKATPKAIKLVESQFQIFWRMKMGLNHKPSSLPTGGRLKLMEKAFLLPIPLEIEEWRPTNGKLLGPRTVKEINKTPKAKKEATQIPMELKPLEPRPLEIIPASDIANIIGLVKSGFSDESILSTLLNKLNWTYPTWVILKQIGYVRCFLISRIPGREKECEVQDCPVDRDYRIIVNATSLSIDKRIRELLIEDAVILGPRHLTPAPKLPEEVQEVSSLWAPEEIQTESISNAEQPFPEDARIVIEILKAARIANAESINVKIGHIKIKTRFK
jgi:hypothetical protein